MKPFGSPFLSLIYKTALHFLWKFILLFFCFFPRLLYCTILFCFHYVDNHEFLLKSRKFTVRSHWISQQFLLQHTIVLKYDRINCLFGKAISHIFVLTKIQYCSFSYNIYSILQMNMIIHICMISNLNTNLCKIFTCKCNKLQ